MWNMGWRTSLMWRLFRIHPFSRQWVTVGVIALVVAGVSFAVDIPVSAHAWGQPAQLALALLRGGIAGGLVLGGCWALGCLPEVSTEMKKRLNRNGTGA